MIKTIVDHVLKLSGDVEISKYLFNPKTISQARKLKDHELPVITAELKTMASAKLVNDWIKLVKEKQKQKPLSHIDICNLYLKKHKENTMYARSNYHRYDSGVWSIFPEMRFLNEVQLLLEDLEKKRGDRFTSGQQKSIASFITQKIAIDDDQLDAKQNLINLKNGTFCTDLQLLLPHDPTDYLTTQLPYDYDDAMIPKKWYEFLETAIVIKNAFGQWECDQDTVKMLQEAIGFSLTASMTFHKSFWCIGEGSNGKGVLLHILQALGGSAATAFNLDMLNQNYNTYHLASLAGKRLVYCTEVSREFNFSGDAMFKAIVGGDKIQVRQIAEKPFVMESISKVWISMNDMPVIKDNSHGFWRRMVIIPFNRIFKDHEQNTNLRDELENELSGIFNWAMIGLRRLQSNGEFTESASVDALTQKHKKESNTVEMFIDEECEIDDATSTTIMPIYKNYVDWCKNVNHHPYSRKNFKKEVERLGYKVQKTNKGTEVFGIKEKAFDAFKV